MKKSKLTGCLVTGFVAAMTLCACNEVTTNKDYIVSFKDYDSKNVSVVIDSLYDTYRFKSDGISKIYNAVLEAVVRYEFQAGKLDGKTSKSLADLQTKAQDKVDGKKEEAKNNQETNHISYESAWQSILDEYDVEDEAELYQHFLYDLEKTEVEDWYIKESYKQTSTSNLVKEFIGVDDEGNSTEATDENKKVAAAYPYHIRHVLASISDSGTKFYNNVITQKEATDLWTIVSELADTDYTFGDVAFLRSGDPSSKKEYGDVGIMTTTTGFVNEFKLGIYAFDTLFNGRTKNTNIENGLHIDGEYSSGVSFKAKFQDIGLATVPFKAFYQINRYAETVNCDGKLVNEGNESYYPRNVYWNLYCNLHQPFLVTDEALKDTNAEADLLTHVKETETHYFENIFNGAKFADGTKYGLAGKKVLVDQLGRVVIGVRGSYGIHFMVMQKSIYDYKKVTSETDPSTTLDQYYTTFVPGDSSYPTYKDGAGNTQNKDTFVTYYDSKDSSVFTARADKVKSAIKGFDSTYDYRIYEHFIGDSTVTFVFNGKEDKNLGDRIKQYINAKKLNNYSDRKDSLEDSWRDYIDLIEVQNANRIEADIEGSKSKNAFRLIPEGCAIGFDKSAKGAEWSEGGYCYGKK